VDPELAVDALDGRVEGLDLPVAHAVRPHELVELDDVAAVVSELLDDN
jgi:hypothetical protein